MKKISVRMIAAAAAALVLAGCGSSTPDDAPMDAGGPTGQITTGAMPDLPGDLADVDQLSAEEVMIAAAEALFTYYPATDAGQMDAAERARPLMEDQLWESSAAGFSVLAPIPGATWQEWAARDASVEVSAWIAADTHPDDQPAVISRVVGVELTVTAADGEQLSQQQFAAYMTARKLGVWRIAALAVR